MLEPYEGKLSRTVLRRGGASNCSFLFGMRRSSYMRKLGQNNEHWGAMAGMAENALYRYQGRPVNVFHEIESKLYKVLGYLIQWNG